LCVAQKSVCHFAGQFSGSDQHDSQEFLSFLLDGLHEDLNRVLYRPPPQQDSPEREAALEAMPHQIASAQEWKNYRMRNDSIVVDYFQGQFRNRLQCLHCGKVCECEHLSNFRPFTDNSFLQTSTTYNSFMYLSLPIPTGRGITKVSLQMCLDAFVKEEIMEKSDAWCVIQPLVNIRRCLLTYIML
jgi:ubiquitin carboxyl-terminal hydrolase 8